MTATNRPTLKIPACPSWCDRRDDHDDIDQAVDGGFVRWHDAAAFPAIGLTEQKASVWWGGEESTSEPLAAVVMLEASGVRLQPAQAGELARYLIAAAEAAETAK
jgi:hypothetical protein